MFFKEKRHDVHALLRLGFLLCQHYSIDSQGLELWHLLNPKLEDKVSKSKVEAFLNDLVYVAVNLS